MIALSIFADSGIIVSIVVSADMIVLSILGSYFVSYLEQK